MSTTDARGHTVPEGTDPAARQSLLDLSLSIPSVATAASETAANQHVQALIQAGVTVDEEHPVHVWRSDLGVTTVWDGKKWLVDKNFRLVTESEVLPAGKQLLIASGTKVLTTDGSGKAVLTYGIALDHVVTPLIATGDGIAAPFVSRGQWSNKSGCDIFAYNADGSPIRNGKIRVNYIVLGW